MNKNPVNLKAFQLIKGRQRIKKPVRQRSLVYSAKIIDRGDEVNGIGVVILEKAN